MGKSSITQSVEEMVEPVLSSENLELVDVQYLKEGKNWYLRIFIDKPGGVTVDDCQKASSAIGDLIEIEDVINSNYILEVSSPGLDRPLKKEKDFLRYKGRKIQATTFSPINDQRNFKGVITGFQEGRLELETQCGQVNISLDNLAKARLEIEI